MLTKLAELNSELGKHKLPGNTGETGCWDLISKWRRLCEMEHASCSMPTNGSLWFPTRLLDVSPTDSNTPRLVIVKDEKPLAIQSYLALSHCWGKSKILTLKSSNIKAMQQALPLTELPRNFRQAIQATKILGFRYLWIDSLCIIQDSIEDWRKRSCRNGQSI